MKKVKIYFDEPTHTYTDDEGNKYTSVTTYIDEFKKKYDSEFWAMYRALDQMNYKIKPNPSTRKIWVQTGRGKGKWYGLTELYAGIFPTKKRPQEIQQEWKQTGVVACERGNHKHNFLEDCINDFYNSQGKSADISRVAADQGFILQVRSVAELEGSPMADMEPEVYDMLKRVVADGYTLFAEKRVYSYEHRISGTIDVLAVNDAGEFWIIDWKTNKDPLLFESGYFKKVWDTGRKKKIKTSEFVKKNDRMLPPLSHLHEAKGTLYTLQLSLYAYICELWGLKCKGLVLTHIRPILDVYDEEIPDENGNVQFYKPEFYQLNYLKDEIASILNLR
jgi:hypothetical protein